ncbi:hypothetical protein [Ruminococcus flavefaciens]|uniref:hypothetical protein n=1 Tax=Ruminococcus flavefaciens TaxID=1265 RepID=UPI0015673F3D|nr:hypothetical protein [Ruminococcus flavefaciens]
MDYGDFLDIISQAADSHSDSKYTVKMLMGDEQKYASQSFGNDYDFRLNFDTDSSATLLMSAAENGGDFEVGKATFFYRTREQILDCQCWMKRALGEEEWLERVPLSQVPGAEKAVSRENYIMAGFGQTSVWRDRLTLANQFRALELYLDVLQKWTEHGGGLLIEPAGSCFVQDHETSRLGSNDVDLGYLGVTARESMATEKLCRKQGMHPIKGAYQRYTLGAVWVL